MIKNILKFIVVLFVGSLAVWGFVGRSDREDFAQIANPASVNCVEKGGRLEIKKGPRGEYGVCFFDDNRQCEEWAMFRGDCPVGGVKITGYVTDAERFCAIRGGKVNMKDGTCAMGGKVCGLENYRSGGCE